MVKSLLRRLQFLPAAEAMVLTLRTGMTSAIAAAAPVVDTARSPLPPSIEAATVETRFTRLHAEGRFDEMWELLTDDAQRAWGGRESFIREMPRLDEWMEILELHVLSVKIVPTWTDSLHQRTYNNVAELVMRYRVRQQWREWAFERQVHLVPTLEGWRTLCYPTRPRTSAYAAGTAASR